MRTNAAAAHVEASEALDTMNSPEKAVCSGGIWTHLACEDLRDYWNSKEG